MKTSPDFLQALVEASPVAMVVVDLAGRVQLWNPAAEQLFGWPAAEALGRFAPHVSPEQQADFLAWLAGAGQAQPERRDVWRLRSDGTRLRLRVLTAPIRDPSGRIWGVLGMHADLAEQVIAEAELDRQRRLLQTIIDNIPVMIAFFDSNGRFLLVNREWERVLGWDLAVMNAQPDMMALFYPDPAYRRTALDYMQAGTAEWRAFRTMTRYGTAIQAVWANVRLPDGTSIGIGQDVTAIKRQADALQHQLDLMHLLLESIPFGYIYVEAPSGKILRSNSQAERILGHALLPADSTAGYSWYNAFHPDGRLYGVEDYPVAQVLRSGAPVDGVETHYRRGDGQRIVLRNSAFPVRDTHGAMIGVFNLFEDITERLQLEERLLQSQKMESIGRLAGGIAHDFNNLLVPIIGYVDLSLSSLAPADKLYVDLQQVRRAAERAADLTRQILAFSRRQLLEMRLLDLNELVRNFQQLIHRLIGEDILLQTLLDPALVRVRADPGQIEQVLLNLVVNARDAMPNGGALTIETANVYLDPQYVAAYADEQAPGPYVLLAVSDTGHGMDAATRNLIFEPFFTTKAVGKGTGLGLSTVFGIVKQHQGLIWVHSEPQKGATFKIYLPQAVEATHAPPEPSATSPLAGMETLLVVEDDAMVRQLICESLHAYGYYVLQAVDAADALRRAAAHPAPIQLLLTDVIMPGMNGRELYQRLVALRGDLRVLYMSGYAGDTIVRHGILEAGIDFLQKPFTITDLARKVRQVLER
jgi:PAS domain S-box-containing protein